MTRGRRLALAAVLALQALVLLAIVVLHGARMASGTHVLLQVAPVDPTDLVRGSYVDLAYPQLAALDLRGFEEGDDAWIALRRPSTDGEAWTVVRAHRSLDDVADADAFLRLAVVDDGLDTSGMSTFYEDSSDAVRLEQELSDGNAVADLVLDDDGVPALQDVREAAQSKTGSSRNANRSR